MVLQGGFIIMEKVEVAYTSANLSRIDKQLDDVEARLIKVINILYDQDIIDETIDEEDKE
jgi:hypothetical protein